MMTVSAFAIVVARVKVTVLAVVSTVTLLTVTNVPPFLETLKSLVEGVVVSKPTPVSAYVNTSVVPLTVAADKSGAVISRDKLNADEGLLTLLAVSVTVAV